MTTTVQAVFRWLQFASLFALCSILVACGSSSTALPPATSSPDVYAAGWDLVGNLYKAVYWKNGVETVLDSGSNGARAKGIAVANGNVYVVGFEGSSTGNDVAVLWVNGVATQLADRSHYSIAWAITLSGTDVYIAGTDAATPTTTTTAVYWKNGVEATLSLNGLGAKTVAVGAAANSIALDGNGNVYVGGSVTTNSEIAVNSHLQTYVASYWKNGSLTMLGSPLAYSNSQGIAVSDGDVYVAGNLCATPPAGTVTQPGCSVAAYWKNGNSVTQSPASNSGYSGVAISGSNIYLPDNVTVSGVLTSGNLPELSTNGTLTALSTNTLAAANCVFVYGANVYVGGGVNGSAGYWNNGNYAPLPLQGSESDITAIDVVPSAMAAL